MPAVSAKRDRFDHYRSEPPASAAGSVSSLPRGYYLEAGPLNSLGVIGAADGIRPVT
jgi:hypothetical protein